MASCLGNSRSLILLSGLCLLLAVGVAAAPPDAAKPTSTSLPTGASPLSTDVSAGAPSVTTSPPTPSQVVITSRPLLGQNGTGQRWTNLTQLQPVPSKPMVVSEPISATAPPSLTTAKTDLATSPAAGAGTASAKPSDSDDLATSTTTKSPRKSLTDIVGAVNLDDYLSNVDTEEAELTEAELRAKNFTLGHETHHMFYNSSTVTDAPLVQEYLKSFQNLTPNSMLSKSHRRAMTIRLKFLFPFYGHLIDNITVATGGFIYTGDYVHSWLAATQFIAPLMANFDTSLSNDSFVKYYDNGTAFTVLWENVPLQDVAKKGGFTFSATLHKNGDIIFAYYNIPMTIDSIEDKRHPVKVGLSDAYISDKTVFYTRRKTIFEYHRVSFESTPIASNTMIIIKPEPTCNIMMTCGDCMRLNTFKCGWCPTINRCSTGTDRKRHDWIQKGCEKSQVTSEAECPIPDVTYRPSTIGKSDTSSSPGVEGAAKRHDAEDDPSSAGQSGAEAKGNVGTAMGILIPFGLVILAVGWVFYAYRHPHTKSGQLLIQMNGVKKYRPSQWSWRRGEARYTAATIHM